MTPIEQFREAGFTDKEIGEWSAGQRETWRGAGFTDPEIDDYLGGPKTKPSAAFLDRLSIGSAILDGRVPAGTASRAGGMGEHGPGNFLAGFWKGLTAPAAELKQSLKTGQPGETAGAIVGRVPIGQVIDQIRNGSALLQRSIETGELPGLPGGTLAPGGITATAEEMVGNALLGMTAPVTRLPGGPITRLDRAPTGELREVPIGDMPDRGDASAAVAAVVGLPHPAATAKVERLWEDHGIHPAEVAHDAVRDPTIVQDLLSSGPDLPRAYVKPEEAPIARPEPPTVAAPELVPGGALAEPPPQLRTFAPGDLRVDAQRFQFKEGGDVAGVTERLQGVTQWDPLKAGLTLVYEDNAGSRWIADGHQRLGLARRIEQADPAQAPRLNSWVLREADGVTDADVRAVAAAKNIAEGTGTAVDAAKVLRDRPELMDALPPRSELVRQARGLMNLEPEAFGKVINDVVPPNYASIVGRLVESDPKLQNALIDLLAKTQPENVVQAESIVRSGIDAGLHTETQATLFGDQELVSSLYADRARILDRAMKQLRRDRTVFQAIVDNSAIIEDLGNRLAQDANARRASIDGQAVQLIQTLANRRGALSDALSGLARSVAARDIDLAAAARDFVAEIRRQTESGALTRGADGGSGSPVAAPRTGGTGASDTAKPATAGAERNPRDVGPAEEARAAQQAAEAIAPARFSFDRQRQQSGPIERESDVYAIRDKAGSEVSRARITFDDGRAYIHFIDTAMEGEPGRLLGTAGMRAMARSFFEAFPTATELGGLRVSGSRGVRAEPAEIRITREQILGRRSGPALERTDQGAQFVFPGAERSARQAAQSREDAGRGMATTDVRQQEPGGLFEAPKADEPDLFFAPDPNAPPVGMGIGAPPPTRTPAEQTILDRISVGERSDKRPWSWHRLYTDVWDRLHPISEMVADTGEALPTSRHPYRLARLLAGNPGRTQHWLEHGQVDFASGRTIGPSLKEILAPVQSDLDGLRAFAASVRALELENRGIETGMNLSAARQVAAAGLDQYSPILARTIQFQDNLAKYMLDAGVLSQEGYAAMREANRLYIPFYRVIGDEPGAVRGAGGSLTASNPIHRIKGSEREVVDPIESIIRNTYLYVTMAERNRVGNNIVDLMRSAGDARGAIRDISGSGGARDVAARGPAEHFPTPGVPPATKTPGTMEAGVEQAIRDLLHEHGFGDELFDFMASAAPPSQGEIAIYRNGHRETWQVGRDVADAVKALDVESSNTLLRMLAMPARLLRAGATLSPDFMIRNPVRDFFGAFVQTSTGVFTPIRSARGLYSAVVKDEHFQEWLKAGGGNSSLVSMDRRYLQESLRKLTEDAGLMSRAWNVVRHPIDALRMVSELSEQMTRVGEFRAVRQRELRQGATPKEAAEAGSFASREATIDFARMGAKMRAANMLVAFMNATLQGSDRLVRAIKDNPVGTGIRIAGGITLPSVLLWAANHQDERYYEIPQWERDLFWLVMTKDHIWRIPKPFELGVVFGSGVERLLDAFVAERPDAAAGLAKSIAGALLPSMIPTAAVPVVEQWANRSSFTDRNLIPTQAEKMLPEYQYTPYTTELAKALGQIVSAFPGVRESAIGEGPAAGVSRALSTPILIENYVRGWTGGLGVYALKAADAALRKQGLLPDPPKPEDTLADIPVVKAFVVRHPSASAESIQQFYDGHERNKRYFDSWMAKAREGDLAALDRIQAAGGQRIFVQLDAIKRTLGEHSKLVRDIWKDAEMPPEEKRQLIDQLYSSQIQIAKGANNMMRQVDAALAAPR